MAGVATVPKDTPLHTILSTVSCPGGSIQTPNTSKEEKLVQGCPAGGRGKPASNPASLFLGVGSHMTPPGGPGELPPAPLALHCFQVCRGGGTHTAFCTPESSKSPRLSRPQCPLCERKRLASISNPLLSPKLSANRHAPLACSGHSVGQAGLGAG